MPSYILDWRTGVVYVISHVINWPPLIPCNTNKPWGDKLNLFWFPVSKLRQSVGQLHQPCDVLLLTSSFGIIYSMPLQWRQNGRNSDSNHQPRHCLLNRLFRRGSKKTSKLRVTGLCVGNSTETGAFPAQMASNAENVSIWWRHHAFWLSHKMANITETLHIKLTPNLRLIV